MGSNDPNNNGLLFRFVETAEGLDRCYGQVGELVDRRLFLVEYLAQKLACLIVAEIFGSPERICPSPLRRIGRRNQVRKFQRTTSTLIASTIFSSASDLTHFLPTFVKMFPYRLATICS